MLDSVYRFQRIVGHKNVSPTSCPGQRLMDKIQNLLRNNEVALTFNVTRYYSPIPGQLKYFHGSYKKDVEINCGLYTKEQLERFEKEGKKVRDGIVMDDGTAGDCVHAAASSLLNSKPMTVAACPQEYPIGTRIKLEGIGTVTCLDRGGAIKGNKIDIWAGFGSQGLRNIISTRGGILSGILL